MIRALSSRLSASLLALGLAASAAEPPSPVAWQGAVEVAAGRGERGPWRQNDSRYDYVDDPTTAVDERGEIAVAWVDQARKEVFFQRLSGEGAKRGPAVDVSRSPATFSWLPRIALAPDAPRRVFLLWQEIVFSGGSHGGDILFARSEDGGASFAAPVNLSNSLGGDGKGRIDRRVWHNGSLDLAAGPGGALYAAWTEYEGSLWFSRSTDGGAHFSPPRRLAGSDAEPVRAPSLALGPGGTVYLAWTVGDDPAADIRVAVSRDGGVAFGAPRVVAPSPGYSDAPKLAVDPGGVVHLVYTESAGGPFERSRIRYTRSRDGARSFEPARDLPLSPGAAGAGFPSLAIDGGGNLYVLWEIFPDPRERPRGLALTVSVDGGRTFAPPATVPGSADPAGGFNGSHQGLLMKKLAVNSRGVLAVVNSSLTPDRGSRVWLMRGELRR